MFNLLKLTHDWGWCRRFRRLLCPTPGTRALLAGALLWSGCVHRSEPLHHFGSEDGLQFYRNVATEVDYPAVKTPTPEEIAHSTEPHTVLDREHTTPWDMTIEEAVHIALQNNRVIRSAGQFLSPGNTLLTQGERQPSVYDPAIQESGVLFGTRGVEAALADFDTTFATSAVWGRDEVVRNSAFAAPGMMPGVATTAETANFRTGLTKQFGYGAQLDLSHSVNYEWSNGPARLFPSAYFGDLSLAYRQPLLAGAGTEYTRVAGPIARSFGGISGVTQGVVIARINNDISIADLDAAIRNLVRDVHDSYWDLYLAYRNYDTAVTARNAALATWRFAKIRVALGGDIDVSAESQARDQYFAAVALSESSRSSIFTNETRLRRLLGLPVNDGMVIRPVDEPVTAEFLPDWYLSLSEALTQRVELRKQKWSIKSLELQLLAARSLTKPRLDFVGNYNINGFGDDLLQYGDSDGITAQGFNSFYETLTQGSQTGWGLGVEMTMPLGFRQAHSQVRNIEIRLAKAHQVLYAQELEISHELAVAFQELARTYANAQANFSRRLAAIDNVETIEAQVVGEIKTVDETLRAQERRAQAEVAFFTAVIEYNKALINLQYRKGTILGDVNVHLLEGDWDPDAYIDAYRRGQLHDGALPAPHKHTEPLEFAFDAPIGGVEFAHPTAIESLPHDQAPIPYLAPPDEPAEGPAETPADDSADELQDPAGRPEADDLRQPVRSEENVLNLLLEQTPAALPALEPQSTPVPAETPPQDTHEAAHVPGPEEFFVPTSVEEYLPPAATRPRDLAPPARERIAPPAPPELDVSRTADPASEVRPASAAAPSVDEFFQNIVTPSGYWYSADEER